MRTCYISGAVTELTGETATMLAQVPNLFYVVGLPVALMALSGLICVALFKGLGRILPP